MAIRSGFMPCVRDDTLAHMALHRRLVRQTLALYMALALFSGHPLAGEQGEDPLEGRQVELLSVVTGFHSVVHKKSGLEVRILEADGSATVAQNPVSLFLVVTNNRIDGHVGRVWRLGQRVERVQRLVPTICGIDLHVDVFGETAEIGQTVRVPKVFHLCFLSAKGKLQRQLKTDWGAR
jgi:hypothetical protein